MALELGIGQPDVPGSYADGGLVDLNNASAGGIASVLSLDPATAEAFVAGREARRGYASLAEVGALSNLDPRALEASAEWIVVLPYRGRGTAV
nr:helix-hairpin-helix domain-containing protein [Phytoactinopolyspora alkaliphila]